MTIRLQARPRSVAARDELHTALSNREPFVTGGNLRAIEGAVGGYANTGRLPDPYDTEYREASVEGRITYTVLSYRTPIAWVLDDGSVRIPDVTYSFTTGLHQSHLWALGTPAESPEGGASLPAREAPDYPVGDSGQNGRGWARDPHWDDNFAPDNGAPVSHDPDWHEYNSGEGAIYSLEYLRRKYGREAH